ncbi:MAG: YegS/Rv2252/BmrU family lipid kinase [Roseburia sp.]|nr:YegS/Rv2252/BmrU family lipid kinase [Roseburia sp.]
MKRLLFVYNPVAGQAKIQKKLFEVVDYYDSEDYIVTLCPIMKLSERWEDLSADTAFDRVVCSGGDGTLNILMSFLMERKVQIDVGYLPAGSTNDYAHSLGISSNLSMAMAQTLFGTPHQFDIGRFNQRYFLYVAGFGIFTKVSYTTSQKTKNLLGHTAYLLEGIKQISDLRSYPVRIESETVNLEGSFILGLVTNSLFVGGFKDILPADSALDDGKFEVLLLRAPKNLLELHEMVVALTQNSLESNSNVVFLRCSRLTITSSEVIDWTVDGEYGGSVTQADIQNIQKAFHVIC